MINAVFKRKSGMLSYIGLEGHANSVDEGYDMVCSAVSAVSITIANGITEVLGIKAGINVHDGFLDIDLESVSIDDRLKCQVLLETMLVGLKSMELSFSDYIKVMEEEV
jgi:uncharacterized protein